MALTAYCKKCGREVEAGEVCPRCGTRLGKTAAHAAWCVERTPVKDWMYWNSVMRILLPAALGILLIALVSEGISGGMGAVERMISSGFPAVVGILLAAVLAAVFLVLLLRGKELTDFVVDNRGIHETRYLPAPTKLKLVLRMKSPSLLRPEEGTDQVVRLGSRDLAWKDVARVQLWPEKCMILFYAPAGWLRIPVACTPFTWDDCMGLIRAKLGKKKKVRLPASLTAAAAPRNPAPAPAYAAPEEAAEQTMMDLDAAVPEEPVPDTPREADSGDWESLT
ncbi:MAG: hypothetical protein K6E17_06335 [Clostridiales bacterium]|nr:hypothetical protein [Clostridiales bacterium]